MPRRNAASWLPPSTMHARVLARQPDDAHAGNLASLEIPARLRPGANLSRSGAGAGAAAQRRLVGAGRRLALSASLRARRHCSRCARWRARAAGPIRADWPAWAATPRPWRRISARWTSSQPMLTPTATCLLALQYSPGYTPEQVFAWHRGFGECATKRRCPAAPLSAQPARAPAARGLVSGDFNAHPVAYFVSAAVVGAGPCSLNRLLTTPA